MLDDRDEYDDYRTNYPELAQAEMESWRLDEVAPRVGGQDALEALDDSLLPDEAFDWTGIAEEIVPVVREILGHLDRCCDALLDVEYRTACRRLLARAAVGDAKLFLRQKKIDTAAAATIRVVGAANDTFDGPHRLMPFSRVLRHLGATGSVSSRTKTILDAAGFSSWRGTTLDADHMVSGTRRRIIDEAAHYRALSTPKTCGRCPYVSKRDREAG